MVLDHAIAQVISDQFLTAEALLQSHRTRAGICGGGSGAWTGFSPKNSCFPLPIIIQPMLHSDL
jgi:hypothetical protein